MQEPDAARGQIEPRSEESPRSQAGEEKDSWFDKFEDLGERKVPAAIRETHSLHDIKAMNIDVTSQGVGLEVLSRRRARGVAKTMKALAVKEDGGDGPFSLRRMGNFPIKRRSKKRAMSKAPSEEINIWFDEIGITIGKGANDEVKVGRVKKLLYIWRDCFAKNVREIKATNFIEHSIDLKPNVRPVFAKIPRYNRKEREFAANIFFLMEEAGIIVRGFSEWGARSKFSPKKKGSEELRVVHNFISVNSQTVKPQYFTHRIEEVIETIIKPKFIMFFGTDASCGYWAVPMKAGDEYKTGIVTPHGQYFYLRMGMRLKGASHTYAQFTDLVFGPLPATAEEEAHDSMIGDLGDVAFSPFVDDHLSSAKGFEEMFEFLHEMYFLKCAFGLIYFAPKKTFVFTDQLDFVGFTGDRYGLRPSVKHIEQIRN